MQKYLAALLVLIGGGLALAPEAALAEKRIALVVGNAAYQAGALATPANDAGLIAQTLQAAGFDVVGARDLDQDSLRRGLHDFLDKATASGPDTVAFIYLGGYGLQLEGENYFVPVDAKIARDTDVPVEAVRLSDYSRPLAALKLKANIIVLDAARAHPFARTGAPLAGGLALVEPEPGMLVAFNAAPGTVAPEGQGPYGPYAQALAEMMREGGLPLGEVFDRARLRVNDATKGAEVAWHASKVEAPFLFFERTADAPPPALSAEQAAVLRDKPIRELDVQAAYAAALERDTLQGYQEFLEAYPDDAMANRVRAIVAARREAITWRRSRVTDTPAAYWSYLKRYPDGPHGADAHRRLAYLSMAFEPPPTFTPIDYEVPPPPPAEFVYVRRPILIFDDPFFAFAPPPPVPVLFLAPVPAAFLVLAPPPPPIGLFLLPCPVYTPVPIWVRPPLYVAAPPNNIIYANIHNTVVINNVTKTVTVTNQAGQSRIITPPPAHAGSAAAAAIGPALPPSVAHKAAGLPAGTPGAQPAGLAKQPLPGMKGQPLPAPPGGAATSIPSAAVTPTTPRGKTGTTSPKAPSVGLVSPSAPTTGTPGSASGLPKTLSTSPGGSPKGSPPPGEGRKPPPAHLVTPTTPPKVGGAHPESAHTFAPTGVPKSSRLPSSPSPIGGPKPPIGGPKPPTMAAPIAPRVAQPQPKGPPAQPKGAHKGLPKG
jgi:uncharacterized caspase-like protein